MFFLLYTEQNFSKTLCPAAFLNLRGNPFVVTGLMAGTGEIDGSGNSFLTKAQQFKHILGTAHTGQISNCDRIVYSSRQVSGALEINLKGFILSKSVLQIFQQSSKKKMLMSIW